MNKINRRKFLGNTLVATAGLSLPVSLQANSLFDTEQDVNKKNETPDIIDTNINLFEWPFRNLKYSDTETLISKLKQHRITQAWAGSFEALFHKDIDGVNLRLAEECKVNGENFLLPFGTVNIAWPDWEEDLRRCHEAYRMPGIRVYPIYQTFTFDQPDFLKMIRQAADRGLIIQIVGDMEDIRHHHPIVQVRDVDFKPLIDILKQVPDAKVELLYWNHRVRGKLLDQFVSETNVVLDTARIEAAGEVGRLIEGKPWNGNTAPVPADRLLFGSHAPYFPVEANLMKLFESPLTLEQMKAIMNVNARRFLALV